MTAQQTISTTKKLASLGKIYGFLKYYHPKVAKGTLDWDKELVTKIPLVIKAKNKEELSNIYIEWIERLGAIENCRKCISKNQYFDKNFDLSWAQDTSLYTSQLTAALKHIEINRNQSENFYASTYPVGNIKVTNEPVYKDLGYPNETYRLLGLFKYWNIIEYFYPYKYLTNQDWDSVLMEMIPKIRNTTSKQEYQSILEELIAKLDDSHAWISFNEKPKKYLPIKISHIENKAVVSGFYNDSIARINNLKLGDIILEINGINVQTLTHNNLKYVAGSNTNSKIIRTYQRVLGGLEATINLTIQRGEQVQELEVKRYDFDEFKYWSNSKITQSISINNNVGYINMASTFTPKEFEEIFEQFKTKKYIIVDLRAYPQGKYKMFTRYFNSEKRDFAISYSPDITYPGKFVFGKNLTTGSSRKIFQGKFILLVNEESLSLSEFTAMAFQTADNIITVGNQTAGADGDVVVFTYLGGYKTAMSGNGIQYPDGTETQRKGVNIDIEVTPTIKGLREGRDEVLEKAIQLAAE